ncbi:MAG: FemAB-like protein [Crocinitomicaceae bacterium]|nr:FemAB-like protein [Crocinitomicaceae bacterium]|tara:strand:- start:102622 stop:103692 length:1071 start_codon:yes stop_codon:yes gene_type:complete
MQVKYLELDCVAAWKDWDTYVSSHPDSSPHHRSEFLRIISKAFGHYCFGYVALDDDGNIAGALPMVQTKSKLFGNYATSIPFFNYGGLLTSSLEAETLLLREAENFASKNGLSSFQLRQTKKLNDNSLSVNIDKSCMLLKLPEDMKQIGEGNAKKRAKLRSQAQLAVRKAAELNVPVEQKFGGLELLDDYYDVFAKHMRDLGTPVYAKSFFRTVFEELDGKATLTVVYWDRRPVACGFLIQYGDYMEIPWASTLRDVNPYSVNTHMYWNILSYALESLVSVFDFGRSSIDAGTYKFKKQWGAEPKQCYWYTWVPEGETAPVLSPKNAKFDMAIKVWQKLPVWLTKIIGPPVVKNLP